MNPDQEFNELITEPRPRLMRRTCPPSPSFIDLLTITPTHIKKLRAQLKAQGVTKHNLFSVDYSLGRRSLHLGYCFWLTSGQRVSIYVKTNGHIVMTQSELADPTRPSKAYWAAQLQSKGFTVHV